MQTQKKELAPEAAQGGPALVSRSSSEKSNIQAQQATGILRIQVIEARDLAAKDRRGTSDPFAVVTIGSAAHYKTSVKSKTLSPVWNAVFDISVTPRMLDDDIKITLWDKDFIGKDFLGQVVIPLTSMRQLCGSMFHDDVENVSFWQPLARRNPKEFVSGSAHFKIGFMQPASHELMSLLDPQHCDSTTIRAALISFDDVPDDIYYNHMVQIKPHRDFIPGSEEEDAAQDTSKKADKPTENGKQDSAHTEDASAKASSDSRKPQPEGETEGSKEQERKPHGGRSLMSEGDEYFDHDDVEEYEDEEEAEEGEEEDADDDSSEETEDEFDQMGEAPDSRMDHKNFFGLLPLDIVGAYNLPYENNVTRTSFDCDPFVVISFGKKTFRTRSIRHTLQPEWNERVFLHIKELELFGNYNLSFSIYDYDRFSKNEYIGTAELKLSDIIKEFQENDQPIIPGETSPLTRIERILPMKLRTKSPRTGEETTLKIRYSFISYRLLRRNFWLTLLKSFDSSGVSRINKVELTALLDSIGSTFSEESINFMFMIVGKTPDQSLSYEEAVEALETAISGDLVNGKTLPKTKKVWNKIKRVTAVTHALNPHSSSHSTHGGSTNSVATHSSTNPNQITIPGVQSMDMQNRLKDSMNSVSDDSSVTTSATSASASINPTSPANETSHTNSPGRISHNNSNSNLDNGNAQNAQNAAPSTASSVSNVNTVTTAKNVDTDGSVSVLTGDSNKKEQVLNESLEEELSDFDEGASLELESPPLDGRSYQGHYGFDNSAPETLAFSQKEHIISIRVCPICKKRIKRKGDLDVVSHVALCAHEDLGKIDNFVLGGFLTEAYASRKWYSKIVSYVTYGGYRIGKNNGNIIVQDSATGQLIEERMPSYVRLGIRLLYQKAGGRDAIQSKKIKNLLRSMSLKQGRKFDDPSSRKAIKNFISFHNLNVDEILEPLSNFQTFNQFFYRKLKPDARPIAGLNDPGVVASAADCRLGVFSSVESAKSLWIKGRGFTINNLIQDEEMAAKFDKAEIAIFRLAPQDYHRFHSPLDCKVLAIKSIVGEYYTVNPMAIRTTIDVYTENVRSILYLENEDIGQFIMVCVGAMMVGSVMLTVKVGDTVKKGAEVGYFKFGGSTVLTIFPSKSIDFERSFEENSKQSLETLVKMGTKIGVLHSSNRASVSSTAPSLSAMSTTSSASRKPAIAN